MTKLGDLLKTEREKRGLSLHEIGMGLKINPKILKAIEDGDSSNLPAKTFLRGFVKSYAQYLRLNVDETLQMFQEEYGTNRAQQPAAPAVPQAPQHPQGVPRYEGSLKRPEDAALPVANNNRIYTILFAILLLTLIAFVAKMMDKYQKESRDAKVEVVEATDSSTTTTSSTSTTTLPMSSAALPAAGSSQSTTTTVPSSGTAASVPASTTTTSTLKAVAAPVVSSTSTTTSTTQRMSTTTTLRAASVTTTTSTLPTTTTTTLKAAVTEVIVEALNKVTVRFTLNGGQKWESLELNPDQVHTFRSKTNVQLEVSDGGAVNIIVNGRDRGVPGTIGKPMKLAFP